MVESSRHRSMLGLHHFLLAVTLTLALSSLTEENKIWNELIQAMLKF